MKKTSISRFLSCPPGTGFGTCKRTCSTRYDRNERRGVEKKREKRPTGDSFRLSFYIWFCGDVRSDMKRKKKDRCCLVHAAKSGQLVRGKSGTGPQDDSTGDRPQAVRGRVSHVSERSKHAMGCCEMIFRYYCKNHGWNVSCVYFVVTRIIQPSLVLTSLRM